MNRSLILVTFILMFLSCGYFETATTEKTLPPPVTRGFSLEALSGDERVIFSKLDGLFSGMNRSGLFNGSVLVAKAGKVLYQRSLGYLDKSSNDLLTDSSMFQLASVSKVITATAVLLLHEKKQLDVEQAFTDFFPDFPYTGIKIKDLLNHRSGLPNYLYCLNSEVCRTDCKMTNVQMYDSFVAKQASPYLKPGKRFNYCNTNYALLALLIEKVSGKTYQQFLKEEFFIPLGMRNTATILDIDLKGANTTRAYDHRWRPIGMDASDYVLGDKSLYSTPYDLFLFSEALYHNRIISAETQSLAYTAFSKEKKLSNYGYGWRLKNFKDPANIEVYHNGWWHGYRSSFHRRLRDSLTVVILSNQLNSSAYHTHKVYEILDSASSDGYGDDDADAE
jgi:CubicO group peptidase (beta-lactamase class C family)